MISLRANLRKYLTGYWNLCTGHISLYPTSWLLQLEVAHFPLYWLPMVSAIAEICKKSGSQRIHILRGWQSVVLDSAGGEDGIAPAKLTMIHEAATSDNFIANNFKRSRRITKKNTSFMRKRACSTYLSINPYFVNRWAVSAESWAAGKVSWGINGRREIRRP